MTIGLGNFDRGRQTWDRVVVLGVINHGVAEHDLENITNTPVSMTSVYLCCYQTVFTT
jgi:hypothetical protein